MIQSGGDFLEMSCLVPRRQENLNIRFPGQTPLFLFANDNPEEFGGDGQHVTDAPDMALACLGSDECPSRNETLFVCLFYFFFSFFLSSLLFLLIF